VNCPLCNTPLPDGATECTRCDWVHREEVPINIRDLMAFWLSLMPGLGHLYKGHVLLGGIIFFVVSPLVLAIALAVLPATLGVSIVIPMLFMVSGMIHAYRIKDLRAETIRTMREYDLREPAAH
jgi:hypothetical protein